MLSSTVDTETISLKSQLRETFNEMIRNQRICNKFEYMNKNAKQQLRNEFEHTRDTDTHKNLVSSIDNILQGMSKDNDWVSKEYKHDLYSSFYTDLRKQINPNERNILDQLSPYITTYFYVVIDDIKCEVDSKVPDISREIDIIIKTLKEVSDDFKSKFVLFLLICSDNFYLKENGASLSVKVKYCKYWLGRIFEATTYFPNNRYILPFAAKVYSIHNEIQLTLNVLISRLSKNKHDKLIIC